MQQSYAAICLISTRKVPRHGLDFRVTASLKSQCPCLESTFFSLLIWERKLKFMLQHSAVWLDRVPLRYPSKEPVLRELLHKGSSAVWKTVTNSTCTPLYQKTSEKSPLVIPEAGLTSKLFPYVQLSSGELWKVSFSTVCKLRWLGRPNFLT